MHRAIATCVISVFACSCGRPAAESGQTKSAETVSVTAESAPAIEPATDALAVALPLSGAPRKNKHLQLEVYEAGFDPAASAAPPNLKYFTVGLRGKALTPASVEIPIQPFVFAQNDKGCISRPETNVSWLQQPFGEVAVFTADKPAKGHLTFLVPDDTVHVRLLIAPTGRGLVVAAGDEFTPTWPEPIQTIEDGSTLRVLVLPAPTAPSGLAPPAAGREQVVMDFVIENLTTENGIEFTTSQQLRMVDPSGKFVQPSAATQQIGCRLDDGDVIPPGHARRLMVAYDMPPGETRRLNYRGFEVDEITVDLP